MPPRLAVTGASLIVASTGQQLFGENASRELLIASTTKLMTALVVVQHVRDLSTMYAQTDFRAAPVDSQIGLSPGERMSVHDLLLALMLPSADDAAIDLAYNVGGHSVAHFVAMMNAEARALGLTHTHYSNPIGLDSPENYSSPYDLARLAAVDLQRSAFLRRVVALPDATLRTGDEVRDVVNTDTLLGAVPWINGVKTGHTVAAGYILVSSGTRNGMTLIGSVLGTRSEAARNANALALLSWGFDHFRQVVPVRARAVFARLPVSGGSARVPVIAAVGDTRVVPDGARVAVRLRLPHELDPPLPRDSLVGEAIVTVAGRPVARVPLLLARALPAVSPVTQLGRFLLRFSTLEALALLACLLVLARSLHRRGSQVVRSRRLERG